MLVNGSVSLLVVGRLVRSKFMYVSQEMVVEIEVNF